LLISIPEVKFKHTSTANFGFPGCGKILTNRSKKLLLFFCFCLGAAAVRAQYRIDQWTADDGLPQNSINGITFRGKNAARKKKRFAVYGCGALCRICSLFTTGAVSG
jgi:hypothetical protein